MNWVAFALMTVVTWGLYGAFLAKGAHGFAEDRMKAFLFVGVAYFLIAIIGPLIIMKIKGTEFDFLQYPEGIKWSLVAGILGALGALTALIALSSNPLKGPAAASQVMSLIFAGAPIVAAMYSVVMKRLAGDTISLDWRFIVGLVMGATGGALVTLFKP